MYSLHLTPEQIEIRDMVRDFAAKEIKPQAEKPRRMEAADRSPLQGVLAQAAELGLKTCSAKTAGTEDVIGITGRQGMLPNDPGYLYSSNWIEYAESWCG